jgi:hypothetical protein
MYKLNTYKFYKKKIYLSNLKLLNLMNNVIKMYKIN